MSENTKRPLARLLEEGKKRGMSPEDREEQKIGIAIANSRLSGENVDEKAFRAAVTIGSGHGGE